MGTANLRAAAEARASACVDFCQRLIQTPSMPGEEGVLADLVRRELETLGYDEVWTDDAGNVIGHVAGGPGKSLMLNTHLDHVDAGDPARWPVPPFAGEIRDGAVWGRGAMDIKGPLACQVYAPVVLRDAGVAPPGDLYFAGTVMEEVGGVGAQALVEHLRPDLAVVGEATGCRVARGHRGRVEVDVRFVGHGAHASVPETAANPHFAAARLLAGVERLPMVDSPTFGPASVAPTLYLTDQTSPNVIPEQATVTLDWRTVPEEGPDAVARRVANLAAEAAAAVEGVTSEARIGVIRWRTYTGAERKFPSIFPAFVLPAEHPLVTDAQAALADAFGEPVPAMLWRFATDGGHFSAAGIPTVGFAPGDERLAHTTAENIGLDALARGLLGNAALCARLGAGAE